MGKPVILVNSVTHAIRGQKLLSQYGISSNIVRNIAHNATRGCGFGLSVWADPLMVQNILMRGGIKVLDIVEVDL